MYFLKETKFYFFIFMLARFLDAYNMIFAVAILKTIGQRTN